MTVKIKTIAGTEYELEDNDHNFDVIETSSNEPVEIVIKKELIHLYPITIVQAGRGQFTIKAAKGVILRHESNPDRLGVFKSKGQRSGISMYNRRDFVANDRRKKIKGRYAEWQILG